MVFPTKGKHVTEEQHSPTMPHDKTDKLSADKAMDKAKGIKEGSARDNKIDKSEGLPY